MSIDVLNELRTLGRNLYPKAPPIPIVFNDIGEIGHVAPKQELYINSGIRHHVDALVRDHYRAERAARELTNGRLSADDLLPIFALGSDSRDAVRAIKSMRSAITSWDSVVAAIQAGKSFSYMGQKVSTTTVAANWSSLAQATGQPGAATYGTIPNPTPQSPTIAGAWPINATLGATEDLYLTNVGTNHATGTNIMLAVDIIYAAGGILTSIVTSQNVTLSALPRWTGGAGLQMTLEVTVLPSTTTGVPTVTVHYVDQGGGDSSTGAVSLGTTSPVLARLLPLATGPFIQLAAGDYGIQSVSQATFNVSAAGAGGAMALLLYKPHLLIPTLATTSFVERSTPAQIGGIRKLTTYVGASGTGLPYLNFFALTSTTSTGLVTIMMDTVWG